MTDLNNLSKSVPNNAKSSSQLVVSKSSFGSPASNPHSKFSKSSTASSISTTLFGDHRKKRNFFDSPRSSFSKSYSASALRISRTSSDYDEKKFNDFRAVESSDEENNKDNSNEDDLSSSDDNGDDNKFRNGKSNEVFKKNLAFSSSSSSTSISKLSSFKFSNFKVNNASSSIKNIFSLKSVESSPSSTTSSPKSLIPSNNFNFEMHHLSPKTTTINQNNEIISSSMLNKNNSGNNNGDSNKIEFFHLTTNSKSTSDSNLNLGSKGPNIFFKKIGSKKALTPKLKAFKRVANELQIEMSPIDDELKNEMVITSAIKDEDEILNSHGASNLLLSRKNNPYLLNQDNLKKFEIINKANESWNHNRDNKKSISSFNSDKTVKSNSISRRGSSNFLSNNSHLNQNQNNSLDNNLKRKINYNSNEIVEDVFYNDSEFLHYIHPNNINNSITQSDDLEIEIDNQNNKRRLVCLTNSPILGATAVFATGAAPGSRRGSTMLIQSTSDDLEMMSLR